jgi:hypothetical protein
MRSLNHPDLTFVLDLKHKSMKKIVWIYGLVIGVIISANTIVMMSMMKTNPGFEGNEVVGYAAMVILFSLIFFGVRNYRNKLLDGVISFGKAFKTGFLIALVGSTLYVASGLLYMHFFMPEFIDLYIEFVLKNTPPEQLQAKTTEMTNFKEMYKNPFFAILISYFEVLPIGVLVALISALILKKKQADHTMV